MTARAHLAAAALAAAALAGCGHKSSQTPGALFSESSSVAVFRGVTTRSGRQTTVTGGSFYRPYIAVANAGSNEVSIIDGVDDTIVPSSAVTRGLVYAVPGRPVIVAAGDLGDQLPDLLVVVTAGDLPWLGGTQLRVIRTWRADGQIVDRTDGSPAVDFGADVLALLPLPADPSAPGAVTLVAILADERIATVQFSRKAGDSEGAIDVDAAQATVKKSAGLGFQPVAIASPLATVLSGAAITGDRSKLYAASVDKLPGGVQGVARIDLALDGTPSFGAALNAHAPTRLVAAGRLREAIPFATATDRTAFDEAQAPVDRVWAILDEGSCGTAAAIACGLVAIDPLAGDLVSPDPTTVSTWQQSFAGRSFRAPIPIPGYPLALGFAPPPVTFSDPQYAGTYQAVVMPSTTWATTGVLAVASSDGFLTFVDAARWNVPSNVSISASVNAKVTSTRPSGASGAQWLTLVEPTNGTTVAHNDPSGLSTSVSVTPGYTPSDRWIVAREGTLPGLASRRAEAYADGTLSLQVSTSSGVSEVVRVWDPTLGVSTGDIVVIEPSGLGTCTTFEASIAAVNPPATAAGGIPARPGGSLTLAHRTPTVPAWDRCVDLLATTPFVPGQGPWLVATIRAGGYVLVRGTDTSAVHVGRPEVGTRFEVAWSGADGNEITLADPASCPLPPAVPWSSAWETSPPPTQPTCDVTCRARCMRLQASRLARRVRYVDELGPGGAPASTVVGPAIAFTLGLAAPTAAVPRDLALVIDTTEGSAPFRLTTSSGFPVDPRQVLLFDRSPWAPQAGMRVIVPWTGNVVLEATPSAVSAAANTIH